MEQSMGSPCGARGGVGLLLTLAAEPLFFAAASAFVMATPFAGATVAAVAATPSASLRATDNAAADGVASSSCSSNTTHCGWIDENGNSSFQKMDKARADMTRYLWKKIMPYDVPNAFTLGFDPDNMVLDDENGSDQSTARMMKDEVRADGLSDGILNQTLYYSLQAKTLYPWTDTIPRSIYMEYVVPYAVVNEPRSDHRPFLFNALRDTLKKYERSSNDQIKIKAMERLQTSQAQIKEVVKLINTRLWSILGRDSKPIVFKAGLTPRIYDPLSVVAYGHSSCTGLAVLFVASLRSIGIPARMAGTPAWHGDPEKGNHSWVEVFLPDENGGKWLFLEPTPGIAEGEEDTKDADDLDRDPCKRWFCSAEQFNGLTKVFATRFNKDEASTHYPMAWSVVGDEGVPGEDRSDYYNSVCGKCIH